MKQTLRLGLLSGLLILVCPLTWAARPMVTDDANVVDPRACQVETWVRSGHVSTERWAVPGCNFFADTELSVGSNLLSEPNGQTQQLRLWQLKKRWRVVEPGQWGLSTTVGRVDSPSSAAGFSPAQDTYLNIPITLPTQQGTILHWNLGAYHHQAERVTQTTWGMGGEVPLNPSLFAIMEAFGETGSRSKVQMGLRYWIIPQAVQIDTTFGQDLRGTHQSSWFSLGLRLLTPALY